ncbi:MAG: hypothetical protein IPF79_02305 [Ignavibacteria bacterium]|nr:hypothetical protein [Ignavibacteria bacterium]
MQGRWEGIAIASLTAGHGVVIFDINDEALVAARNNVIEQLRKAVGKGKLDAAACHRRAEHCNRIEHRCDVDR